MKKMNIVTAAVITAAFTAGAVNLPEKGCAANEEIIYGDLNNDKSVDITDLTLLSLHLVNDSVIEEKSILEAADVQYDGEINLCDLAVMQQYLSKKTDSIGKKSDYTDITEECISFSAGHVQQWWADWDSYSDKEVFLISCMEEYEAYYDENSSKRKAIEEHAEISEEFFENNRIAVMAEEISFNGASVSLKAVKTDSDGNVHLYYDRVVPGTLTCLGGQIHWVNIIPGNPHNDSKALVHYNE